MTMHRSNLGNGLLMDPHNQQETRHISAEVVLWFAAGVIAKHGLPRGSPQLALYPPRPDYTANRLLPTTNNYTNYTTNDVTSNYD